MQFLKRQWPILSLLVASVILCVANFTPNTFLSGWDTLHPEFNFGLSFERIFFGVFRVEQGLGAVAAHSHMADLPRVLILYLEHFILPLNFLRYSYIFLTMILGPVGMYLFLEKHLLRNKIAAFSGALFYLLNLGTMQIFNVPFEMFATLFATLPFIFLFATSFLTENSNQGRNLLLFAIFTLFTSPSAYAATLWFVFFGSFIIYILSVCIVSKHKLKDGLTLIGLTILINAFWLAPNIYFVLNHAKEVQNANINILFSDQAFLKNKEFGNLSSLLMLKSFYFDWGVYGANNQFTSLLTSYINYLKNIPITLIGWGLGLSLLSGLVYFIKKQGKLALPFVLLLLISIFFLINQNFPFSHLFRFFQDHFPFFKEALRFPDDKILNIYIFLCSIFFGFFVLFLQERFKGKSPRFFALVLIVILLFLYNLPSFKGNFINKAMRVNIPNQYFQLFDYLNKEPSYPKVANLPINSPWGWVYYDWYKDKPSFQGAGFLYFGIKQPLMDRDFDRWSPYNESYYRQMSYAIYKKDSKLVKDVITKYGIGYIFIDETVIDPQHSRSTLFFNESKDLIKQTGLVNKTLTFGKITLFKVNSAPNSNIKAINTNINVNPQATTIYNDSAYSEFGSYITTKSNFNLNNVYFPFRDLIDNQSRVNQKVISVDSEKITFSPSSGNQIVNTEKLLQNLDIIPSDLILELSNGNLNFSIYPNAPILDETALASPLKGSVDLKESSSNLLLSVNENEVFDLNKLTPNTPFAIGKISLKNADNSISVFDKTGFVPIENTGAVINPFFANCQDQTPVSAILNGKSINLKGKGNLCVLIPLGFYPDKGANGILANFGFDTNTTSKVKACLFSQETSQCLYYIEATKTNNSYNFSFPLLQENTNKRAIKIFFEDINDNQNITLTNFVSSYSPSLAQVKIPKETIENIIPQNQVLKFNKIYLSNSVIYDPGFTITGLNKLGNGCGVSDTGTKKEIINIKGQSLVKYTSTDGTFCDHYSYPNLSHKLGYLVIVESRNESGLPLTLCLTNYTSRKCDIYSILSYNKELKREIFLLSPTDDNGIGYDLNLEALGIEKSPSVNFLKTVEIVPIPFDFLNTISKENSVNLVNLNGKIEKILEFNPNMYIIKTNGIPAIIDLNYSFENGFKAYQISCGNSLDCFIKSLIVPITNKPLDQHVLINNWSNGWIVNTNQVAIIFVPQYLEWLGFIILIALFPYLLYKVKN